MNKDKIIDSYTVVGVPNSSISYMCKELNVNEDNFWEFMAGQTLGLVNGETMIYPDDIKRFVRGLPNLD